MDKASFKPVGSVLSSYMDETLAAKAGKVSSFFKSWRNIAGARLCDHSRVVEVEKGIVIVEAEHPSWIQLLQMRQEEMLISMQKGWPELQIRGIAFRLPREGRSAVTGGSDAETAEDIRAADKQAEALRQGEALQDEPLAPPKTRPIRDEKLASALERLRKTIRERGKDAGRPKEDPSA